MPQDVPDRMREDIPEDMLENMPEDMPDRMPEDFFSVQRQMALARSFIKPERQLHCANSPN